MRRKVRRGFVRIVLRGHRLAVMQAFTFKKLAIAFQRSKKLQFLTN